MYQLVKLTFPFAEDFHKGKPRPALVVSPAFGKHNQLVVAYITKDLKDQLETDMLIDAEEKYFFQTGLRTTSLIKLHRLVTVTPAQIKTSIGVLSPKYIPEVKKKLLKVFQLK